MFLRSLTNTPLHQIVLHLHDSSSSEELHEGDLPRRTKLQEPFENPGLRENWGAVYPLLCLCILWIRFRDQSERGPQEDEPQSSVTHVLGQQNVMLTSMGYCHGAQSP